MPSIYFFHSLFLPVYLHTLGWADLARLHGVRIEPGSNTVDQHHSTAAKYRTETWSWMV